MRRIIFAIAAVYVAGLALVDEVAYYGRYRQAIWNEINVRAYRSYGEVVFVLDRLGITSAAARNKR